VLAPVHAEGWLVGGAAVLVVSVYFVCWRCVLPDVLLWRLVYFFVYVRVVRVQRLCGWRLLASFWCVLVSKPRKGMVMLTRRGLVTNVFNSFLDLGSYAYVCNLVVFGGLAALTFCRFQVCWDLQVSIVLSAYTLVVFVAQKTFYACCTVQGVVDTWFLLLYCRSIHSPFLDSNSGLMSP
jgi:hypothetical protein